MGINYQLFTQKKVILLLFFCRDKENQYVGAIQLLPISRFPCFLKQTTQYTKSYLIKILVKHMQAGKFEEKSSIRIMS